MNVGGADDELVRHIETTVGRIDSGWMPEASGTGIVVARIHDQPDEGTSTFVTLGLSRHLLVMTSGREVRQEFIFAARDRFESQQIASFLQTLAESVGQSHHALLRGDVVGPSDPLIPGIRLNAGYAAIPVLHDPRLRTFDRTDPATVFVWIVPIHGEEADFVRRNGWETFEERLEEAEIDLCDLERNPIA